MTDNTQKTSNAEKIRVMLVDDSAVVRGFLSRIFEPEDDIEIAGTAANGQNAITGLSRNKPDIILLDVEMPIMNGLEALPEILAAQPEAKVVMCSTLTHENADTAIKAMELGAVDCIGKPSSARDINSSDQFKQDLLRMVRHIGGAMRDKRSRTGTMSAENNTSSTARRTDTSRQSGAATRSKSSATAKKEPTEVTCRPSTDLFQGRPEIIAIGSSTGGPQALMTVLKTLETIKIPIIITQHMPKTFTKLLANHISEATSIECYEADDAMPLEAGKAYIAKGGYHMLIKSGRGNPVIKLDDGDPVNYCKPAIDPMVFSALEIYGRKMLGVILTGMGHDGLESMKALSAKNGRVIAQDEASSVVWGMPGAVAKAGICSEILPLDKIGPQISSLAGTSKMSSS